MTLRQQTTAALALLAAVAAIVAAVASYTNVEQRLTSDTDGFLSDRLEQVLFFNETITASDGPTFGSFPVDATRFEGERGGLAPFVRFDAEIAYLAPDGSTIFAISEMQIPTEPDDRSEALQPGAIVSATVRVKDRTFETRLALGQGENQTPILIQVARDITEQEQTLSDLRSQLALLVAAVVVLAAVVGFFLSTRLVRPLDRLRAATPEVAERKDFSKRLDVHGPGEVSDVTTDFNSMLHELDEALKQQHRLVQDAGHELRTPLTTLRASVELMQRMGPDHETDREELLSTASAELVELSRLVEELVSLAASPFDETPLESIDLADLVTKTTAAFTAKNPSRTIEVVAGTNAAVSGKRHHLERAIANIVSNADKFAPAGTAIRILVDGNRIEVRDHGPGIPTEDLTRVFDKFFRSPSVQSINGSGLGLAALRI